MSTRLENGTRTILPTKDSAKNGEYDIKVNLTPQLREHLSVFYNRLRGWRLSPVDTQNYVERTVEKSRNLINTHNISERLNASPEYQRVTEENKIEQGECEVGAVICVDGRIPKPHVFGNLASIWESKAGVLFTKTSPVDGSPMLTASRLEQAVAEHAQNANRGPLLEILFAHTSLSNPNQHACGAMLARREEFPEGADLVLENIKLHRKTAKAMTAIYNKNVSREEDVLQKVAITAVFDTDHMGVLLGYETKKSLSSTEVTRYFADKINAHFNDAGIPIPPGLFRDSFHKPETLIQRERTMLSVTKFLLRDEVFNNILDTYIDNRHNNLSQLSDKQRQALKHFFARTVSRQYVDGVYQDTDHHHHPFAHHGEGYQAVSLDGVTMGQNDPENQVFGASMDNAEGAIDHIRTQFSLMNNPNNPDRKKPFQLFLSKTVLNGSNKNEKGLLREVFNSVLEDKVIKNWIINRELVLVPVLIDAKDRQVVEIPNFVAKKKVA